MRKSIDAVTRNMLIALMALLVIGVVWQVFTRYVLQSPSTYTDELARFLLIWVGLLGAAYYSGQNVHISIDIFPRYLSPPRRRLLYIGIKTLIIAFVFCVFVVGGGYLVYITYVSWQITPALQIPMAVVYLIGPMSGLLIIYYHLSDIRHLILNSDATGEQHR
jgi:TRAP-type C4-dicarboxylate transport system permease small subunit